MRYLLTLLLCLWSGCVSAQSFTWTRLPDTPIPTGDGIGAAVLNGKLYSVNRWIPGASLAEVWSTPDGQTWTAGTAPPYAGRHSTPTVVHNGRIFVIGGDFISGVYQPQIYSWDGIGSWVTEESSFAALNRVGHFGFSLGGQICFGGGQTMTPMTPAPTKFFTDLWCSTTGTTGTWAKVSDDIPIDIHGFVSSGSLPILGGEAYAIAGGTYTSADYPDRSYTDSIVAIGGPPGFSVRLTTPKNQMPGMFYNSTAALGGVLFSIAGHNGVNLNSVWSSFDSGKTVVQLANFPGPATHAMACKDFNDEVFCWGGLNGLQQAWKLTDAAKIHLGAAANGTTNLGSTYTICDRTISLTAGKAIKWLRIYMNGSHTVRPKIGRENSTTNFDFVYNGTSAVHPGGGYADFSGASYVIPSDGATYRVCFAFSFTPGTPDAFAFTGARSQAAGDLSGNGVTLSAPSDGATIPIGWTE